MSAATSTISALITGGFTAGAGIYGAHKQASANTQGTNAQLQANRDAIAAQTAANEKALAWEKEMYGLEAGRAGASQAYSQQQRHDTLARLQPWIGSGQNSTRFMSALLHLPDTGMPANVEGSAPPPQAGTPLPSSLSLSPTPTGQHTTALRAPDGSVQYVPDAHVDHYLALGAQHA